MNVGDVHLDDRCLHGEECVKNRDGRCGEPGGIEDQPGSFFRPGLLNPVDDLTLVIGLPELDGETEALRRGAAKVLHVGERGAPIDFWLTRTEQIEIWSVENKDRVWHRRAASASTPATGATARRAKSVYRERPPKGEAQRASMTLG